MLFENFARRRARHVHRNIPAANDDDLLPDRELVSQIHIEQKINALVDSVEIDPWNAEIAAAMRSDGDQHGVEALPPQFGNRKIATGSVVQLQRDVARLQNLADLRPNTSSLPPTFVIRA